MAGAGYKLFNTGDVLTAQQVNEYLQQQTVMVFANSTARTTALASVLAEGMMSYLQDTNSVEVYNGSAWVAVGSSPLTTKGDLYTYSTTNARLASSAVNGDVLTVDTSTATGLKWAASASGGMTLISTTTLTGASTITISSIPATYKNLQIVVRNFKPATDNARAKMRFNSDANARYTGTDSTTISQTTRSFSETEFDNILNSNDNVVANGITIIDIPDYANTTTYKIFDCRTYGTDATTTTSTIISNFITAAYNQTGAINAVTFFTSTGNFTSGDVLLYGVK